MVMYTDLFNLSNKTAVVIGGTSGIGETISLGLAQYGADVVAVSRNMAKVKSITEKIKQLGRNTFELAVDASHEESIKTLCSQCLDFYGGVDVLVNAAGINIRKSVREMAYSDWQKVLKTNLDSAFLSIKHFSGSMAARNYGKIINIGSLNSVVAMSNLSAYAASKGGIVQLTKAAAVELSGSNVTVNAILPGYFHTEMTAAVMQNATTRNRIVDRTPVKRIGKLEELVGAAVFLASDASAFITGETLAVDGGFLAFGVNLALK